MFLKHVQGLKGLQSRTFLQSLLSSSAQTRSFSTSLTQLEQAVQ